MLSSRKRADRVRVAVAAAMAAPLLLLPLIQAPVAIASSTAFVTVDFSQTTAMAGRYVFGVSSWPRMDPAYAPMLADSGVTMIRQSSIGMAHIIPTTTVADYLNNVNNVQDPSTWNWNPTGNIETIQEDDVDAFNAEGIDVFSIIAVTPSWLGVTTDYGAMPSNWTVYEDIVKKTYLHYKDKIKFFEIYNEPEIEISLGGSSYPNVYAAYTDLYKHALDAINSVDPGHTGVGGPAAAYTNSASLSWLTNTLADPAYSDDVDFASWHHYNESVTNSTDVTAWNATLATAGKPDLPTFMSEYNLTPTSSPANSNDSISWVAGRLTTLMEGGATGAFIYGTDDRASGWNATVRHDWHVINQDGTFTPRMRAIRLLSKSLGLGAGEIAMKSTQDSGLTIASGAINANGYPVVWAVNDSSSAVTTDINLEGTGIAGSVTLTHYVANSGNDATSPTTPETKTPVNDTISTTVTVPPKSVYGIVLGERANSVPRENIWGNLTAASYWGNGSAWELGTKFTPTVSGSVPAIRVYSSGSESGDHVARIWDNTTGLVVGGPYTLNYGGATGWITYTLPAPVALTAGRQYTVSVSTGTDTNKNLPFTTTGATSSGSNGLNLSYPANAGVTSTTVGARPTVSSGNNYLRDVVFQPSSIAGGKTATSSSSYGAGWEAGKAVDGLYFQDDASNTWASGTSVANSWWKVDLGAVTTMSLARIQFRGYNNPSSLLVYQQVPTTITFQVSDDNVTWTNVIQKSPNVPTSGASYSASLRSYSLDTEGRYLRLLFEDGSQGGDWAHLNELVEVEVYR